MTAYSRPASFSAELPASIRALYVSGAAPRLRLVCFPHSGGGAYQYRLWGGRLPEGVDLYAVQLPGREDRIHENPFRSLNDAVTSVSNDLLAILNGPFAIFGHSLGAMIGAEVALRLAFEHRLGPERLFVSGSPALSAIDPNRHRIHDLPDEQLLDHVRRLNGTPAELLADERIRSLILRVIRGDYAIFDGYTYTKHHPLSCPVTVFGGESDPTTTPETLGAWSTVTTGPTDVHLLPGGHFFLHSARDELLTLIRDALVTGG